MKELTSAQIAYVVSKFPGCKKNAVENFLMTVHHNHTEYDACQNLAQDAWRYGWNKATKKAIDFGIEISAGR